MKQLSFALLALAACVAEVPGAEDDRDDIPSDDWGQTASTADDGYVPHAVTAQRFGVFYEVSPDVLTAYQNTTTGLPEAANHAWIISQSLGVQHASRALANAVHARGDFYYAATFDLWKAYPNWQSDSDASLAQQAHAFRDQAIAAHADLFAFNEVPSGTPTNAKAQDKIATILRGLHDKDAQGRQLQGVVFFTEAAGTPDNWSGPATAFFKAIDDTSISLVVEHYHAPGFICGQSESALAAHFFALRTWLENERRRGEGVDREQQVHGAALGALRGRPERLAGRQLGRDVARRLPARPVARGARHADHRRRQQPPRVRSGALVDDRVRRAAADHRAVPLALRAHRAGEHGDQLHRRRRGQLHVPLSAARR